MLTAVVSAAVAPAVVVPSGSAAAGAPGGDPPPPSPPGPPSRSPSSSPSPAPKKVKKEVACCRCLRAVAEDPTTPLACEYRTGRGRASVNCSRCSANKRGGATGCVPVPPSLEAEAASLVRLQRRHLAGGPRAPPLSDVAAAAEALVDNLRLAPTNVARASAGPLPVGGRARRAPPAAPVLAAGGGDLGQLVEAVRAIAEMLARVNNLPAPQWS
ncbi:hypothetical protein LTS17_007757 [Exophiala oligosperma]